MSARTLYLNNSGSKWIHLVNGKKEQITVLTPKGFEQRTVLYYSSFGNFATVTISYKGKKHELFADRDDKNQLFADLNKTLTPKTN